MYSDTGSIKKVDIIDSFKGEYRFLSNFHVCDIEFEGAIYPSTEHAYQAAKTINLDQRLYFQESVKIVSCGDAKRHGQKLKLREHWDELKIGIMFSLVSQKFANHLDLRNKLLETKDKILIEGNYWHDRTWGICTCSKCGNKGLNHLGEILMQVRYNERNKIRP